MTSKALRLAFPPGEYMVTWTLPTGAGETFDASGILTVTPGQSPKGVAHGFPFFNEEALVDVGTDLVQKVSAPEIRGHLSTGAKVVLINVGVQYLFGTQARIHADAAIITLADTEPATDLSLAKLELQIGGLDAIAGVFPILKTTFPTQGGAAWSAEPNDDCDQVWLNDDGLLALEFRATASVADPYRFAMAFSPVLRLELNEAIPFRELMDNWVRPLRNVVSVVTGRAEALTYAAVKVESHDWPEETGQIFGIGVTQDPYESAKADIKKIGPPLRLKTDQVSLLDLIGKWQQMALDHHPLIETYGSMIYAADQHPRARFLLLLQAIEGSYGYAIKDSYQAKQETHEEARVSVLEALPGGLGMEHVKFIKKYLSKQPNAGGLQAALVCLGRDVPGDAYDRLGETPLIVQLKAEIEKDNTTANALRIIRNDLAHGNRGYDSSALRPVVEILNLMVRAHLLKLLGCPDAVASRLIDTNRSADF